jgi:BirA family biotin operon repressor/biotin-[acetyl-CoA-carboxylase] ligase
MGLFVGLTAVCSLGLLDVARGGGGGDVAIDWPSGIVSGSGEQVARVGVRAATGDLGMFAVAIVDADLPVLTGGRSVEESVRLVRDAIVGRVDAWSDAVRDGRAQAGPLAPVLSECYDSIARMGEPVRAISRDGREVCRGVLAGVDVWGRVTIHTAFGQDIAFAGEQASLISL